MKHLLKILAHSFAFLFFWIAGAMIALAAMVLIEIASNRQSGEQVRLRIIGNRLIAIPLVFVVGLLALGPAVGILAIRRLQAR